MLPKFPKVLKHFMSSSLTKTNKSTNHFGLRFQATKVANLRFASILVLTNQTPSLSQVLSSSLLPAYHWLSFIATMSQLTPHTTLVLGFPTTVVMPFSYLLFQVGLYEFSLGKTIYFHHMPTLIHHTSSMLHLPFYISNMLHRISLILQ